jgi:hypothetical protein
MGRPDGSGRERRRAAPLQRWLRERPGGRTRGGCVLRAGAVLLVTVALPAGPALAASPAWSIASIHAPTIFASTATAPIVDEVQMVTVSASKGSFHLTFEGEAEEEREEETGALRYDATAERVQRALEKLSGVGKGNVTVTGGPGDAGGTSAYRVTFLGALSGRRLEPLLSEGVTAREEEVGTVKVAVTTEGARDTVDYQLIATDPGAASAKGPVTVTDVLPAGLSTKATPTGHGWSCTPTGEGQTVVTCISTTEVNPDSEAEPVLIEAYVGSTVLEGTQLTNEARVEGGGVPAPASTSDTATVSATPAVFGIQSFSAAAFAANGERDTRAAGHPYAATTSFVFNTVSKDGRIEVPGNVKDVNVKLPTGFVGDPQATPLCTQAEFTSGVVGGSVEKGSCRAESQVGTAALRLTEFGTSPRGNNGLVGVYDLVPPPGVPAEFGFIFANVPVRIDAHVEREDGEYRLTTFSADINEYSEIFGVSLTLWGVPADASHTAERFVNNATRGAPDNEPETPFLTNPANCVDDVGAPPTTTIAADSWEQPGRLDAQGDPALPGASWQTASAVSPPVTGCELLKFEPSVGFAPSLTPEGTTQADEPSGYTFKLGVPQEEAPRGLATPELKNATVTLPDGVSISPSAANGLAACSDAAINLESTERGSCPEAAQIGTVKIVSPLLGKEKPLEGRLYLGEPECSPCGPTDAEDGKLLRLFIEAEGAGVRIKLPGTASLDTSSGQLTATFDHNPQLPFETLELALKNGPRAPLANPQACGSYATTADLTPWSLGGTTEAGAAIPGTPDATPSASFKVDWNGAGGACPGILPFGPGFVAGTESSTAGAYSPFEVTFSRHDREQDLAGITVRTPPGLLGKIAGVTRCAEPQASSGACPAASQIGTAAAAAGAGSDPYVVSGPVYLTEAHDGAPFGLSIVVPANAGPFHLGNVIVRAAINVNPRTSALTITSDPLPQGIDGIPFRIQTVSVNVNRPGFTFNPTNCTPQSIRATITGAPAAAGEASASATASAPFTASSCAALAFKPTLTATTQAKTSKLEGASLSVKVEQPPGSANIHAVELQLPKVLPSRLTTLQQACTEAQFDSNPAGCPAGSVVGHAKAITPLLNAPLEGPAYLVSHGGAAFPDLVFLLEGEGVHIELVGATLIEAGSTYSKFETVPDAPISSFEVVLPEGPHSVLAANGNLCRESLLAPTTIIAQDNARVTQDTRVAVTGCPPTPGPSLTITRAQVRGNALLLTLKTSAPGTVKITGAALRSTLKKALAAGTHQIAVPLSYAGKAARRHHGKIKLSASLTVGSHSATETATVRV